MKPIQQQRQSPGLIQIRLEILRGVQRTETFLCGHFTCDHSLVTVTIFARRHTPHSKLGYMEAKATQCDCMASLYNQQLNMSIIDFIDSGRDVECF